ncbi:hypothetical protein MKX01_019901 [Papaver californicum]|nr:hypothetical protein MKX01_019901 [Papaver californicum]
MGGAGAVMLRLWWCFFFAFAIISSVCSARSIASAGNEIMMVGAGRSLKAMINDYDPPSANKGHDPRPGRRTLKAMINDYDPPTANKRNDNRRTGGRSSGGKRRS